MVARKKTKEEAQATIMGGALVITGIMDFFGNVDSGDNPLLAAGKAIETTKKRGEAIKEAVRKKNRGR